MAIAGVTPAQAASTSATAAASAGTNLGVPRDVVDNHTQTNASQSSASSSANSAGSSDTGGGSAYAFSTIGRLAVSASSHANVNATLVDTQGNLNSYAFTTIDAASGQGEATAVWSDNIHVSAPGYHGGGYLVAHLLLNGTNSASTTLASPINITGAGGSSAYFQNSASAALTVVGTGLSGSGFDSACASVGLGLRVACARLDTNYYGNPAVNYSLGSIHDLDLIIPLSSFGDTSLTYELIADSGANAVGAYVKQNGSSGGQSAVGGSDTLLWGGVSGLYDGSGKLISDVSISSDSGFNYLNSAAPEPGLWALMTASVAGMGMALRTRRRRLQAYNRSPRPSGSRSGWPSSTNSSDTELMQ